jgi:hypothetical protein
MRERHAEEDDNTESAIGSTLVTAAAELSKPDRGALGPLLRRLPDVTRERQAHVRSLAWADAEAFTLLEVCDCYDGMLRGIHRLIAPVLDRNGIEDPTGKYGRFLFQCSVLLVHREDADPIAPLLPVLDLAMAGPCAENDLMRRLSIANDGRAAILVASARTIAASATEQAYARRVIPGLNVGEVTDVRDRALYSVASAVLSRLRRLAKKTGERVYPAFRARLQNEPGLVRVTGAGEEQAVRAQALVDALDCEWRRLDINTIVGRGLGVDAKYLHAGRTLANRQVDHLRRLASRDVEDPVVVDCDGIQRPPARVSIEQNWKTGLVTAVVISDEQDVSRPAPLIDALQRAEASEVLSAMETVIGRYPLLSRGYDVLAAEQAGDALTTQAQRHGVSRQTLAKYRDDFLAALRAELGLTSEV